MKIKRLKKIKILDHIFFIKWIKSPGDRGGYFDFNDMTISIGVSRDENEIFDTLMHELSEAIHVIINTRYKAYGNIGDYKFVMDHKEFQLHNKILSSTILQFIE